MEGGALQLQKEILDKAIDIVRTAQEMEKLKKKLNCKKKELASAKVEQCLYVRELVKLKHKDPNDHQVICAKKHYRVIYKQIDYFICLEEQSIHLIRFNILKIKRSLYLLKKTIYILTYQLLLLLIMKL